MTIAPYYQKMLSLGLQAVKSLEPITFTGMFDSGVDYLFTLSIPLFTAELKNELKPIFVDLSGLTTQEEVTEELKNVLSQSHAKTDFASEYPSLVKVVSKLAESTPVVFVLYLGQEGAIDPRLFIFLNQLRNLLGWRFSYCVFTTTRLLQNQALTTPLIEKVLKRNLIPVLPLDSANSEVVLENYEERYGQKLSEQKSKAVIAFSGGNPGLIKALYLQAIANRSWEKPDLLEEQLYFRLQGIAGDLSNEAKAILRSINQKENNPLLIHHLIRYGYGLKQAEKLVPFTPLLTEFIQEPQNTSTTTLLHLTKSQRNVLEYLKSHPGGIISKDAIAQVLWGENWADKYSDWAIDQLISTLRDKLAKHRLPGKIITKKAEGIIFLSER